MMEDVMAVASETQQRPFPRTPLYAAGLLILAAIAVAATARMTDFGTTRLQYAAAVESRELRFEDRADGSVAVFDAKDGSVIETVDPGTKGFIRIVMRALAHTRMMQGVGAERSFTLTRWEDGRLSITDPATSRQIELVGFGSSNVEVFAKLLASERASP
jgi:putative photosynthetic complex assembly protein